MIDPNICYIYRVFININLENCYIYRVSFHACTTIMVPLKTYCYIYRVAFQTGATVTGFTMMRMLQLQGDILIGCYNCRVYLLEFLRDATVTGMENRNF